MDIIIESILNYFTRGSNCLYFCASYFFGFPYIQTIYQRQSCSIFYYFDGPQSDLAGKLQYMMDNI